MSVTAKAPHLTLLVGGLDPDPLAGSEPSAPRCVITGCREPLADTYYCAPHRRAADDGSLWPSAPELPLAPNHHHAY
jgi:hypothetical protein